MKNKAFATLEVLFASAILAMFLVALFATLLLSSKILSKNKREAQAMALAQKFIEQIQTHNYADIGVEGKDPTGTLKDKYSYTYDNILYELYPTVLWIDDPEDAVFPTDGNPKDYKQLKVLVRWNYKGQNYETALSTYIYK